MSNRHDTTPLHKSACGTRFMQDRVALGVVVLYHLFVLYNYEKTHHIM